MQKDRSATPKFPRTSQASAAFAKDDPHKIRGNSSQTSFGTFCNIFEYSPVAVWEADFSEIKGFIDAIKGKGVDFTRYINAHPDEIVSLAGKIGIYKLNKATLELYNAKKEAELCKKFCLVHNKLSYDVFAKVLAALSEGRHEFSIESVIQTIDKDDRAIILKIVVPPGYERDMSHVFIYMIDISELKLMEQDLTESEIRYRTIVENAHDTILLVDLETGIITEANKKAEYLFGISSDDMIGMHFAQLLSHEEAYFCRAILEGHDNNAETICKTLPVINISGERIPVSISTSLIQLKGKKYILTIIRGQQEVNSGNPERPTAKMHQSDNQSTPLSQRELQIITLISSGKTSRQISRMLNISEKTVQTHRSRIMQKLNIHKVTDIVQYAIASGLTDCKDNRLS